MKQLLQDLSTGQTIFVEAPMPRVGEESVLIRSTVSLISAGTERMLINFSKANLFNKARQQPEKVAQVLNKIKTDGVMTTLDAVRAKINEPLALGYSNVGIVEQIGSKVSGLCVGDRVVSAGSHADMIISPAHFVVKIPENVSDEDAVYTVVSSIALQGIRLAKPEIGEKFAVIGVGLIGLIATQILIANGCQVLAVDYDQEKLDLAASFGAEVFNMEGQGDIDSFAKSLSGGFGLDGVLVCAATKKSDPMNTAATISRMRGRVIQIGLTGLGLERPEFYSKEIEVRVSCSFGPGRYDPNYYESGLDYPIGFVRWTAQRNFEAILDLLSNKMLQVERLTSSNFKFENAGSAYKALSEDSSLLGVILEYTSSREARIIRKVNLKNKSKLNPQVANIAFVGAGNYASRILIPAFKSSGANLISILSAGGISGAINGKKFGFSSAVADFEEVLEDEKVNSLAIATRHSSHAEFVEKGLRALKNVFVEKPLAIDLEQLSRVEAAYKESQSSNNPVHLMVGFNRRFAPHTKKMMELLEGRTEPLSIIMTINSGSIPLDHWTQNQSLGGGRIIGEGCHFVDLMRFIVGQKIQSITASAMGDNGQQRWGEDKVSLTLKFSDGSLGTIHYFANGAPSFPKERIEVFTAGKNIQIDNFIKMKGYGFSNFKRLNLWRQDKGQEECVRKFCEAVENGSPTPIPAPEIFEVSRVVIEAAMQMRNSK